MAHSADEAPSDSGPRLPTRTLVAGLAVGAGALLLIGAFNTIGGPHTLGGALANAAYVLLVAGTVPVAYVAGGIGLGALFAPLTRHARDGVALRAALGVATMLWISSTLGTVHLGVGLVDRLIAGLPVAVGLALLVVSIRRAAPGRVRPRALGIVLAPPAALLLAAALNPPGWLWASEFGGYDALSYHLQLPQAWLAAGRVLPLEHNVYSFLPGFVESAFAHLAVLAGVDRPYAPDASPTGLLTGDGLTTLSCQLLHALLAILSAWLVARATALAARRLGADDTPSAICGIGAGALFLATPWIIVTGSLAYNEMAATAMLAGALLGALDDRLAPWIRGLACGWLIGAACGAKPTAFFLAGVPLGLVLLGLMPARAWLACAGAGCAAGLVCLAPWLARNAIESGNPVFPYATSIFGSAHWTAEQVERFAGEHAFHGSIADRLALVLLEDTTDPSGPRHRGLMHTQWLALFPLALAGLAATTVLRTRARLPWLLAAMLIAQIALWLATTHIQSRFLIPAAVTGSVLVGTAGATIHTLIGPRARVPVVGALALAALVQLAGAIAVFADQAGGHPNQRLLAPPAAWTGAGVDDEVVDAFPHMTVNRRLPPDAGVYLLADATPFYITRPVRYNTTWDAWPIGEAIRADPDDPRRWTETLRRRGIRFVLVDLIMLDVYHRSGSVDPDATPERVGAWLADDSTRPVRDWREAHGKVLVELRAPGGSR